MAECGALNRGAIRSTFMVVEMGGGMLKRLWRPGELNRPVLEVDWSVISLSSISLIFRDLLADLLGVPRPPDRFRSRFGCSLDTWRKVDVKDLYRRHSTGTRFLIKGVIYDMSSLMRKYDSRTESKTHCNDKNVNAEADSAESLLRGKDWTSIIHMDLKEKPKRDATAELLTVSAADVVERLGVQRIPGLQERIVDVNRNARQRKLEEKQKFEEILGTGDSVRAKYLEKIREKKMMAEARREREKFSINSAPASPMGPSRKGWQVTPGSPALVRYLEERGISQALVARGDQSQLNDLVEELRNYKFQHIRNFESVETVERSTEEVAKAAQCYNEILSAFCASWGLPSSQVLLVIGDVVEDEALHKALLDSQYFVCKVRNPSPTEDAHPAQDDIPSYVGGIEKRESNVGFVNWFKRLSEGTLHEDGIRQMHDHNSREKVVHFKVMDMTQLKSIIEDLNGVSYRSSTFVQGFND